MNLAKRDLTIHERVIVIEEIKKYLSIRDVLVILGEQEKDYLKTPIKDEKTPSLKVYYDTNSFFDFSANVGGDQIDLYAYFRKITLTEAIIDLYGRINPINKRERTAHKEPVEFACVEEKELFEERACIMEFVAGLPKEEAERYAMQDVKLFRKDIRKRVLKVFYEFETLPKDVEKYIIERKLSYETISNYKLFGITDPSKTVQYLKSKFNQYELTTSGLFKNNYFIFTKHKIVIPYMEQGQFVFMKARNLNGAIPKYIGLSGVSSKRFYNADLLRNTNDVIIVEGEFDALKLIQDTGNPTIAVSGVGNIPGLTCLAGKNVYLLFDNDEAGNTASKKLFDELKYLNIEAHLMKIESNAKDISELL